MEGSWPYQSAPAWADSRGNNINRKSLGYKPHINPETTFLYHVYDIWKITKVDTVYTNSHGRWLL